MATSYPYRTDDRLYAAQLDWDLEQNPGPNPPGSPLGGAGKFKHWVDTRDPMLPVLRQCIVDRAKNSYDPAEWMTLGTYDIGAGQFIFDDTHVHFPPQPLTLSGDVFGTGNTSLIVTELAHINASEGVFQGLTVDTKGRVINAVDMRYAPLSSPAFENFPTAPTMPVGDYSDRLATTKFVKDLVVVNAVTSWNERIGAVTLTLADVTGVGGAPINNPNFLGVPTAVTAPPGTSTNQLATCEFVTQYASHTFVSDMPPPQPVQGDGWFHSVRAELYIWFEDEDSGQWVIANTAPMPMAAVYRINLAYTGGVLANNQLIGLHKVSKNITIPPNFGLYAGHLSEAGATANATAATVLTVGRATAAAPTVFTAIGTITFGAGSAIGAFATTGGVAIDVLQGEVLRVIGPATADATLANVYLTIVAQEA